jgi:hypothetical protein
MGSDKDKRYFTKSRFKTAVECPTKLFYTSKKVRYVNASLEDAFLKALAEGGFQVGALARLMYPGGIEVRETDAREALEVTRLLLERDQVTIFEAAISSGNLFARVDILVKNGLCIDLIEVKAKSFDAKSQHTFRQKKGKLEPKMLPYLQDVAFQRHLMALAYPALQVQSFLMMADKSSLSSVAGLNQLFKINRAGNGSPAVTVSPSASLAGVGQPILAAMNVDAYVDEILSSDLLAPGFSAPFSQLVQTWAEHYDADTRIATKPGAHCAKCEFRAARPQDNARSGFHECWRAARACTNDQIDAGTIFDVWNLGGKQELLDAGVLFWDEVRRPHLNYLEAASGLSDSQRQWMQVSGQWPGGGEFYLDRELIAREMQGWRYPLHFIDFETSRVAIPFAAGQRPYSVTAFQFSHHVVDEAGQVRHQSQFLQTQPGQQPNYDFVRALQQAVGAKGTIFMWWPHENSTLNAILEELETDAMPPPDAAALKAFILSVTSAKGRCGERAMVDLCTLSRRVYFHPLTQGSSSIKKVLPSVLQSSEFLRERYSQPVRKAKGESLNFDSKLWWVPAEGGGVQSPYALLPPVFEDMADSDLQALELDPSLGLTEGGAATTAYARLQFDDMARQERERIDTALLRYCELDTLAMVMVYQAWKSWLPAAG